MNIIYGIVSSHLSCMSFLSMYKFSLYWQCVDLHSVTGAQNELNEARNGLTHKRAEDSFVGFHFYHPRINPLLQIDLPLSVPFFKCLLGMENTMTSADLDEIDPILARSLNQLEQILREKKRIEADRSHVSTVVPLF